MTFGDRVIAHILGCGLGDAHLMLGLYRRAQLRDQAGRWRQATLIPRTPFVAAWEAFAFVRRHGAALRAQYGVGHLRQWATLVWAALRHSAQMDAFTAYWAFAVDRPRKWNCWIGDRQAYVLFGDLAERCDPALRGVLRDKVSFADWGAARSLPTVPALACFAGGAARGTTLAAAAASLPSVDLFAKPASLSRGRGTRRWTCAGPGLWHDEAGRPLGAGDIVAEVALASREDTMLLQRCLQPHPGITRLAPSAISTVRCVTWEDERGEPQLLGASIRLPVAGMIVDNVSAGGTFAGLDLDSGRIGRAIRWRDDELLEAVGLPGGEGAELALAGIWPEIRRLALDAQRAAAPMPSVGWDIALTAEGPVLLEANIRWGGTLVTLPQEVPLGETALVPFFIRRWAEAPPAPRRPLVLQELPEHALQDPAMAVVVDLHG